MSDLRRLVPFAGLAVCLLMATFATAEAADPPFTGVITGDGVNVRAGEGENYYVVLQLDRGAIVEVIDERFGWYEIKPPQDAYSYISKAFVDATSDDRGVVTDNRVRVRAPSPSGPSRSYRTQLTLNDGAVVVILDEEDGYYRIRPPEGAHLYVSAELVEQATEAQIAAASGEEPEPTPEPEPAPEPVVAQADEPAEDAEPADEPETAEADDSDAEAEVAEAEATDEPTEDDAEPRVARLVVQADGTVEHEGEIVAGDAIGQKLTDLADDFDHLVVVVARQVSFRQVADLLATAEALDFDQRHIESMGDLDANAAVAQVDPAAALQQELEQAPQGGSNPQILEQELEEVEREAREVEREVAEEAEVAEAEPEVEEPLSFEELEQRYRRVSELALSEQPLGELRMDYEHLLAIGGGLSDAQRRLAQARVEVLSMRQELQTSLFTLTAVEEEAREAERRREEQDLRRREYLAVGRLTTSTLYTGEQLPLLYRIVDPLSGRTLAYVEPKQGVDPINLIGEYVGVHGRRDYDGTLGLYVVLADTIDQLTPEEAPAGAVGPTRP